MHPLDLVDAAPWRETVFTTYALSLSFFEAVVLDRLVRGGARNALILSDPEGIRAGLSEMGARRAGRDYELEPIASCPGVFHAKISALIGEADSHLIVGSGNLTFGGWGMNMEVFEHLHPSFAASAFVDTAGFFEALVISDRVKHGVGDRLEAIAASLRLSAQGQPTSGAIRVLHSLEDTIASQLARFASELGGAERIVVVSPFFDRPGRGLKALSEQLDCTDIQLHVHDAGTVRGFAGSNWPEATPFAACRVDGDFAEDKRLLHAKCLEISCRQGRIIVSGSVNATLAALETGNVETAVVRIQRDATNYWSISPSKPPLLIEREEDEEEKALASVGILRASLEGDQIVGQVLTRLPANAAAAASITTLSGQTNLGTVTLASDGRFAVPAPEIESESWSSGRLVLRLVSNGDVFEGFVTLAAAREIIKRAGAIAPKIMALLGAMETPADVAAILSWFAESPERMLAASIGGGEGRADKQERAPVWVTDTDLASGSAAGQSGDGSHSHAPMAGWARALDMILAAFAKSRGSWRSGTETDDQCEEDGEQEAPNLRQRRLDEIERLKRKALEAFHLLLERMLAPDHAGRNAAMAFTVGHYLVDRNRPASESVRPWLQRVLNAFVDLDPTRNAGPITAVLLLRSTDRHDARPLKARQFLLRRGIEPASVVLAPEEIPGFIATFAPEGWDGKAFLAAVREVQTPGEEIRRYLALPLGSASLESCPHLASSPFVQKLMAGLTDPVARGRRKIVDSRPRACPKCSINLDGRKVDEMNEFGMTVCCRVILCTED